MKRFLALLAGGLGLRALLWRRRRATPVQAPAEELRARLAESREAKTAAEPEAARDEMPDAAMRRADVHERARRALDDLGGSSDAEPEP
jgi:hypothetical protein